MRRAMSCFFMAIFCTLPEAGLSCHILGEPMLLCGPGRMCTIYVAAAKRFRTPLNFTILHPETVSICQTLTKFSHWHGNQDWHEAMPSTQIVM